MREKRVAMFCCAACMKVLQFLSQGPGRKASSSKISHTGGGGGGGGGGEKKEKKRGKKKKKTRDKLKE